MTLLSLKNLSKKFVTPAGPVNAVSDVSLDITADVYLVDSCNDSKDWNTYRVI